MKYRHEYKYEINHMDLLILQNRLSKVLKIDKNAIDGKYRIRSIYFDTHNDKALREKIDGVNYREKFRIRFYNFDTSYICLEKKSKINGLCLKESCQITKEEAQKIANKDINWMIDSDRALLKELYVKMKNEGLSLKTIVDYTRIPYVYYPGNVRVTIDYDIKTSIINKDFLDENTVVIDINNPSIIFEVKWDEYLPDIIKDLVSINSRYVTSFSKYAECRVYG